MLNDLDSDKWNEYIMNKEKKTKYDDKLLFRDTGVLFTSKGDILSMKIDFEFDETVSSDAKHFIKFLDEMHFDKHAKSKSSRDKNLLKNFYKNTAILALVLQKVILLSENPNEICNRFRLIFQEKQAGNLTKIFDNDSLPELTNY